MPLVNQTTTMQNIVDQLTLHTNLQNFFNAGGVSTYEPGLTIVNKTGQMLLSRSKAWKFNRQELSGPPNNPQANFLMTQYGVQDVLHAGATAFTLLVSATGQPVPNPALPAAGVGVDLATHNGIVSSGGVTTVQTLQQMNFQIGQTVYLSGCTVFPYNSVFTFNNNTCTSAWTQGYTITNVPDLFHFQFATPVGISFALTNVTVLTNVLTVAVVNSFQPGQIVNFSGVATATFLNGQKVTILTATPTQFTAALTHADYASAVDTGFVNLNSGAPGIVDWGWGESAYMVDPNSQAFPQPIMKMDLVDRLAPSYFSNGGMPQVCMLIDQQNGVLKFRLSEPYGTQDFQINLVYQKRWKPIVLPTDILQWPDNIMFAFHETALWMAYKFAKSVSAKETQLQYQVALAAIQSVMATDDNEDSGQALTPTRGIMSW